jgi:hypothetical protein
MGLVSRWSALVVLALLGVVNCPADAQEPQAPGCDVVPRDRHPTTQPLELVACMLDREARVGDPIRVFVALANTGGEPVLTRARLDLGAFLLIRVEDSAGHRQDMSVGEPGYFAADTTDILLPRGGIIGRVIDLTCDQGGYRASNVRCFSQLTVNEPGTYRVNLSYAVLCGQAGCPDNYPWVGRLSAPTLEFRLLAN